MTYRIGANSVAGGAVAGTEKLLSLTADPNPDQYVTPNQLQTYFAVTFSPLASPTFTGIVTVPDAVNPTDAAQFSDVTDEQTRAQAAEALLAPLASPSFTGVVGLAIATTIRWGSDITLVREAADILAQRDGVNGQVLRVYNTFTDSSNYERASISWLANTFSLKTEAAGTGSSRTLQIQAGSGSPIYFLTNGGIRWAIDISGNLFPGSGNAYDIGTSNGTAPRNLWLSGTFLDLGSTAFVRANPSETALAANFTNATATLNSTNLSRTLPVGSYRVTGELQVSNSTASDGVAFDFNGGTATVSTFFMAVTGSAGTLSLGTTSSTSLSTALTATSVTGTDYLEINGYVTVTGQGTITMRGAEVVHTTGTVTFGAGSWLAFTPTNNL